MDNIKELLQFMRSDRLDLRAVALTHVLGLTGSDEGKNAVVEMEDMLAVLFRLTTDTNQTVAKDAVLALINLTADETEALKVFDAQKSSAFHIVEQAIAKITDPESHLADAWTMVLCNLTRIEALVHEVLYVLDKNEQSLKDLIKAYGKLDYNKKKCKLHYLGPFLCNLTQTSKGREILCSAKCNILDKLLPFSTFENSLVRRGGTIGILKNICFDPVYHEQLLSNNMLHALLYPLSGPEEFTDEENDMLPIELQYLPETKTREDDPDLRKMLLESLLQLCATKRIREMLRAKGVYEILREYHKWEANVGNDRECLLACENVVDILIKKEDEIGLDDYRTVDVPEDIAEKFSKDDAEYLENVS